MSAAEDLIRSNSIFQAGSYTGRGKEIELFVERNRHENSLAIITSENEPKLH